jgi:hypothetical protein
MRMKYMRVTMRWSNGELHEHIGEVMQTSTSIAIRPPRHKKFVHIGRLQDVVSIIPAIPDTV